MTAAVAGITRLRNTIISSRNDNATTKMGARDRTQLVVMAYESRLVLPGVTPNR